MLGATAIRDPELTAVSQDVHQLAAISGRAGDLIGY